VLCNSSTTAPYKAEATSKVGTGKKLLPSVSGTTTWARLMRDTMRRIFAHLGGEEYITEPQRLLARRVATFEAELIFLEDLFGNLRSTGGEPTVSQLDLYSRIASAQRRHLEAIGLQRVPREESGIVEVMANAARDRVEA
jgi:hypothetical protein